MRNEKQGRHEWKPREKLTKRTENCRPHDRMANAMNQRVRNAVSPASNRNVSRIHRIDIVHETGKGLAFLNTTFRLKWTVDVTKEELDSHSVGGRHRQPAITTNCTYHCGKETVPIDLSFETISSRQVRRSNHVDHWLWASVRVTHKVSHRSTL